MSRIQSDYEATQLGKLAEKIVCKYLHDEGWEVTPRKDLEGDNIGFDFRVTRGDNVRLIEVKGTKYEFKVPDLHVNEFIDVEKGAMKATHLYIVGNLRKNQIPILNILPTDIIKEKVETGEIQVVTKTVVKGNRFNKLKKYAQKIRCDLEIED